MSPIVDLRRHKKNITQMYRGILFKRIFTKCASFSEKQKILDPCSFVCFKYHSMLYIIALLWIIMYFTLAQQIQNLLYYFIMLGVPSSWVISIQMQMHHCCKQCSNITTADLDLRRWKYIPKFAILKKTLHESYIQ